MGVSEFVARSIIVTECFCLIRTSYNNYNTLYLIFVIGKKRVLLLVRVAVSYVSNEKRKWPSVKSFGLDVNKYELYLS